MSQEVVSKRLQRLVQSGVARPRAVSSTTEPVDLALVFDTTGSMYQYLDRVRSKLTELAGEVFTSVPNTRVAVIAFGDYCDAATTYVVKDCDLTSDIKAIRHFIGGVQQTHGGDFPEAVEEALYRANLLTWRIGARRALVLVGDAPPHGVIDSREECRFGHDYLEEAAALSRKAVRIYAIQCGMDPYAQQSFRAMAAATEGRYLHLEGIVDLIELLIAIAMKEAGLLESYEERLDRQQQLTTSRRQLLTALDDTSWMAGDGEGPSTGKP